MDIEKELTPEEAEDIFADRMARLLIEQAKMEVEKKRSKNPNSTEL
jgi:hypothetical protein